MSFLLLASHLSPSNFCYTLPIQRFAIITALVIAVLFPGVASAKQIRTYTLPSTGAHERWEGVGPISFETVPGGVRLMTDTATGGFLTQNIPNFLADAGELTYTAQSDVNVHFVWIFQQDVTATTNAIKIDTERGEGQTTTFTLGHARQWRQEEMQLGLVLGPHSDIIIHKLDVIRWNPLEKAWAMVQDRKSTRLNSSHVSESRMPSSA